MKRHAYPSLNSAHSWAIASTFKITFKKKKNWYLKGDDPKEVRVKSPIIDSLITGIPFVLMFDV